MNINSNNLRGDLNTSAIGTIRPYIKAHFNIKKIIVALKEIKKPTKGKRFDNTNKALKSESKKTWLFLYTKLELRWRLFWRKYDVQVDLGSL